MTNQNWKNWEEELDSILGDFIVNNSGEESVIISVDAIQKAKDEIMNLRQKDKEEIVKMIDDMPCPRESTAIMTIYTAKNKVINLINEYYER